MHRHIYMYRHIYIYSFHEHDGGKHCPDWANFGYNTCRVPPGTPGKPPHPCPALSLLLI